MSYQAFHVQFHNTNACAKQKLRHSLYPSQCRRPSRSWTVHSMCNSMSESESDAHFDSFVVVSVPPEPFPDVAPDVHVDFRFVQLFDSMTDSISDVRVAHDDSDAMPFKKSRSTW